MRTTQLDNGNFNNYATEPDMYYAVYPSMEQQRNYAQQGAIATLIITAIVLVSFAVS
jgi:hypothetical protein